jgi:hypothetical protein
MKVSGIIRLELLERTGNGIFASHTDAAAQQAHAPDAATRRRDRSHFRTRFLLGCVPVLVVRRG